MPRPRAVRAVAGGIALTGATHGIGSAIATSPYDPVTEEQSEGGRSDWTVVKVALGVLLALVVLIVGCAALFGAALESGGGGGGQSRDGRRWR